MTRVFKHKLAKPNFEKTYGFGLGTITAVCPLQRHITCELYDPTVPIYESNLDQHRGERILFFGTNTNTNNIRNQNFDRIRIMCYSNNIPILDTINV